MTHFRSYLLLCIVLLNVSCDKKDSTDSQTIFQPFVETWYELVNAFTDNQKIDEYCIKAWEAYQSDMPELAYSYIDDILDYREHWKPYAIKATITYKKGRTDTERRMALGDYKKALKLNKNKETFKLNDTDSITYQLLYERMCRCTVNDNNALIIIQKGLYEFPESTSLMNTMSLAYIHEKDYVLAEKWAKKVLEKDEILGCFRLAYLASKQDRHQEAIKYYEKCLELDPNYSSAKNNLANSYRKVGRTDEALQLFREAARDGNAHSQNWLKNNGYTW